ncbi:aromatic ring-hydroxylating dioxygenase subunit alpha [Sphingomonas sp. MG17]|uniref:Aromatic ring-hydroxylating dioxygenase subunit alpha n=1 Tax=Sphingomonas tagetis TaxID=2949092 RepID=A0A9X2KKR8_9SPHN|nr:aromatic ring-hydroxylating dioxygenase subunit alpha [Sphingomonas tagetis]MCP3730015.1 aromatic ring-hydroxylating dioxygenase subunit alpha [Sphingomonas tagetis]
MFLKNCWYVAAWPTEMDGGGWLVRRILDQPVLLLRTESGEPAAFLDRCPHRLVPLSAGQRIGDTIRCGYHGMTFASDGRCVHIPGQAKIPPNAAATVFPMTERHGMVWIWMGDAKLADAELVPDVPWPALPHWTASNGYTHVAADYRLLTDNLLDLSHENYIHQGTIGNQEEETIADFPVKVSVDGLKVLAHREMPNIVPPPFFRVLQGNDNHIDRWQTAIWTAPSINMTDVGARPAGGAVEETLVSRVLHLLTPETETSTHYFWSHNRNFRQDDAELTAGIVEAHRRTFDEDKEMVELQQRELDDSGLSVPQMALRVDDAPLRARRILSLLVRQQQAGAPGLLVRSQTLIPDPEALEPMLD